MASLDDLPLDTGPGDSAQVAPSAPSSPGPRVVVFVVIAAAAISTGAWFYVSQQRATAVGPPGASAVPIPAQTVADSPPVMQVLPPLEQMDPFVRELLAALGTDPDLLKWLATDDVVGSIATAIDMLSQGQSPARNLAVLRPTQGFSVERTAGVSLVAPASYARYAPLVNAVASVDASTLVAAFTTLRPRLAEAYARQGHPDGGFDEAVRRAIAVVVTTPDVPADAAIVSGVGGHAYANPAFERLPPAQKHLIRMGPDHTRRVREAVRRFGEVLAVSQTSR